MIDGNYEVRMIPEPMPNFESNTGWMVYITSNDRIVGKTRFFRTFFFAKRYHDKWERHLNQKG